MKPWLNGRMSRNANRTWTPGSATRSSLSSSIRLRSIRSFSVSSRPLAAGTLRRVVHRVLLARLPAGYPRRAVASAPDFIAGRELPERAYEFAFGAHHGPAREGDTDIDHPVAVAALLDGAGFGDEVVAAALLHDVVEDTRQGPRRDRGRVRGARSAACVEAMTEDERIERLRGAQGRASRSACSPPGPVPASIYAADKLARVRSLREPRASRCDPHRLDHYWDTLELFAGRRPELPFLTELAEELPELEPADDGRGRLAPSSLLELALDRLGHHLGEARDARPPRRAGAGARPPRRPRRGRSRRPRRPRAAGRGRP